jgi:hypothetical protein
MADPESTKNMEARQEQLTVIENPSYSFRAFSPGKEDYTFLLTSDLQFPTSRRYEILQNYYDQCGLKDARFALILGDLVNGIDVFDRDILTGVVDKTSELGGSSRPTFFVRGNHEWRGMDASSWCSYFAAPTTGSTYFSFRCGDVFYIVLDTGEDRPAQALTHHFTGINVAEKSFMQEQKEWLAREVQRPEFQQAKFRIVMAHMAPYSHHGRFPTQTVRFITDDLFTKKRPENRIHLWISGHTHMYSRSIPETTNLFMLEAPQKKTFAGEEFAFPVVTLDGPGYGGIDTSCLLVNVTEDQLLLDMKDEQGESFDRCEILPDGFVKNLNADLKVNIFACDPM